MKSLSKSEKISFLVNFVLVGFVVAIIYYSYCYFHLNIDLLKIKKHLIFADFLMPVSYSMDFMPYKRVNEWICYFPLAYIILFPFSLIHNAPLSLLSYVSIFLTFFIYGNIKYFYCENLSKLINIKNITVLSLITYPFLVILSSCNLDMILFILLAISIFSFQKEKYMQSAILLAIINACKPFAIMFWVLFLFQKKYKEFFISVGLCALLIIFGFFILKGGFFHNLTTFILSLKENEHFFVYSHNGGMVGCSSLFMSLKAIFCLFYNTFSTITVATISKYIGIIISVITLFAVWKEKVFWKQITLLTLWMLTVPFTVGDYKLIFLFIPIWLFVNTKEESKFDLIYTILFCLLLILKSRLHFGLFFSNIELSVIINPFIMLLFMGLIVYEQIKIKKPNL